MANIHGKDAIIYLGDGASGEAIAISEQNTYSIEHDFDLADTTELGDSWSSAVKGIMKWTGRVDGNFATDSNQLWSAATGASASKFYLYPTRSSATRYYYGTVWVKLGTVVAGGTTDKAKSSISLIGEGTLSKN
jgi:hypothetical protein